MGPFWSVIFEIPKLHIEDLDSKRLDRTGNPC